MPASWLSTAALQHNAAHCRCQTWQHFIRSGHAFAFMHCFFTDKASPHWGKGWSRFFTSTACPVKDLYPASNWATQLALQQQYDPAKLVETEMLSAVIAGGAANPGGAACANEMSCYCSSDGDCGAAGVCCRAAPPALPAVKNMLCLPC
jgi:hypothetical protein